jgi:hypothetical protein
VTPRVKRVGIEADFDVSPNMLVSGVRQFEPDWLPMQYDGSSPKPPQRFTPQGLLAWVQKQIAQGWRVVSCYEAGPFGYNLHRQLTTLGATILLDLRRVFKPLAAD